MSKLKDTTNKVKGKIEAIKKINDNPKSSTDKLYDKYLKDLPSSDELFGKKIGDFLDKRTSKKENKNDIFSQLIDLADGFMSKGGTTTGEIGVSKTYKENLSIGKQKIKKHAITAATKTLESTRTIVSDNVNKIFFAGDGICGTNKSMLNIPPINISPKEVDFLNVLTLNPDTGIGQIVYEPTSVVTNKIKFDRQLYSQFTATSGYTFESVNGNQLFDLTWNSGTQKYTLSGLTQNQSVTTFLDDYYSSIIFPDIEHVIKTSMLLTIQGDGSETTLFNKSLDSVERLLQKLLSVCGNPTKRDELKNLNPIDLFDETDEDIESYFDFNNVEGIDLDAEDARRRGVLKFKDCNNFESPRNTAMMEDFIYFVSSTNNLNKLVDDTLNRVASDAFEQSDSSISLDNFKLSMLNLFIFNLPKALISSVLTPKIFIPIVTIYKAFISTIETGVNELMRLLFKLFHAIIIDIFWNFIRNFWQLIKPELFKFLGVLIAKILKNKNSRYVLIVTALINLLTKILELGIDNCADLYGVVLNTITSALSAPSPFTIPGILLGLSDKLPGYSQDRTLLNITERMEAAGTSLGPIYGDSNKLIDMVKSIVDGHTEEMDTNSFVAVSNKEIIIPTPFGPLIIPPGILNSAGKLM